MPEAELSLVFLRPMNKSGLRYILSGGVASILYRRDGASDKHLRDIRSMLKVSGEQIDRAALNEWIRVQGVDKEWQKVHA